MNSFKKSVLSISISGAICSMGDDSQPDRPKDKGGDNKDD